MPICSRDQDIGMLVASDSRKGSDSIAIRWRHHRLCQDAVQLEPCGHVHKPSTCRFFVLLARNLNNSHMAGDFQ